MRAGGATEVVGAPVAGARLELSSPSFDAQQYLAKAHAGTSFAALQSELTDLRRATSDKTEQLKALVSAHFDQYLSCHEAVRALADDVRAHERDNQALVDDMKALKHVTDATLSVMLQRAKEQRRIRNTLSVLSRLRPVLDITSKMRESLQNKDYDKLAEDYCRLKYHSHKSTLALLQRVFTAAHEIATTANTELLGHFDDFSLSVQDQKRALAVLSSLGILEKPVLTCLNKQFKFMERRVEELDGQVHTNAEVMVKDCGEVIYRFRSGLWGLICDLFKTPVGSVAANHSGSITSTEAEDIQAQAWNVLSKCVELLKRHAVPPTAHVLKHLNETFRHIESLRKCPNAAVLNANIETLNGSFCRDFRVKAVLEFVQQTCDAAQQELEQSYFESVVLSIPSLLTESVLNLATLDLDRSAPLLSSRPSAKVGDLIVEARDGFDAVWNSSMVSSEVKIRLDRPSVFSCCCDDIIQQWDGIWKRVGSSLLETIESGAGEVVADGQSVQDLVAQAFERTLGGMLSGFLNKLFDAFNAKISPPTTLAASGRSSGDGARVCILFAVVSNCIELRDRCLPRADAWFAEIGSGGSKASRRREALYEIVSGMVDKCMDVYVSMHVKPLTHILRAGAAEEPQQSRAGSTSSHSSRTASRTASMSSSSSNSRTNSIAGFDMPVSPPSFAPSTSFTSVSAAATAAMVPNDPRQYVFNVLLQLITLRSEVETGLGVYAECRRFVEQVSFPLTAELARFLREAVSQLDADASPVAEWKQIHLAVETRFFALALGELMAEPTRARLAEMEKELMGARLGDRAVAARGALLSQLKHQTKLYLLALQLGS